MIENKYTIYSYLIILMSYNLLILLINLWIVMSNALLMLITADIIFAIWGIFLFGHYKLANTLKLWSIITITIALCVLPFVFWGIIEYSAYLINPFNLD